MHLAGLLGTGVYWGVAHRAVIVAVGVLNVKLHLELSSLISHFYILNLMWILDPYLLCLNNERVPTIS